MASAGPGILPRYVRRRRASFVLTSLIDVIFLLVIFFMVTSQIIPFSMIPLGSVAREDAAAPQPPANPTTAPVAVRVLADAAMVAGDTMAFDALPAALAKLKAKGVEALILIPTGGSKVQDVVSVLEAIQNSGIAGVTVLDRKGL